LYEISLKFLELAFELKEEEFKAVEKKTLQMVILRSIQSTHSADLSTMPAETVSLFERLFSDRRIFERPMKVIFQALAGHIEYWNQKLQSGKSQTFDEKQKSGFRFVLLTGLELFEAKEVDVKSQVHTKYDFLTLVKFCRMLYRSNSCKASLKGLESDIDATTKTISRFILQGTKVTWTIPLETIELKDKLELASMVFWLFSHTGTEVTLLPMIEKWLDIVAKIRTPLMHESDARILESCFFRLLQQAKAETIVLNKSDRKFESKRETVNIIVENIKNSEQKFKDLQAQYKIRPMKEKLLKQLNIE
jgi:hypothetical protein